MQDRKEPLLLFDMDGTLINQKDTPSYSGTKTHHSSYMSIKRQMKEIVIQHGVPKEKVVHLDRMALIWNQTRRILEERGKEENEIISLIEKINVPFMVEERADHSKSVLLPETIPTLKELTQNGYNLGLVTTASRESYEKLSKDVKFGKFGSYFRKSITRDDCKYIKPDPEPIERMLSLYKTSNFIYIGDSDHDGQAAKTAGGKFILINTRNYDEKTIISIDPDHVIDKLSELPYLLEP
ncbi:HAD-IIIA family hydrolase [Candidatus Bathyarchaeota archaeon]|nr:HAD-IIIA family hydrolase [Candidatus Bathyarchaeota archaeon]